MKQSTLQISFALAFGLCTLSAQAAMLNTGDILTINPGIASYDSYGNMTNVPTGSWYGCDCNGNYAISSSEKTPMSQGTEGIIIGVPQGPGILSHAGTPTSSDWNRIDAPYTFFGNTGLHFTTTPITGGTTNGLDFSGWHWDWNTVPIINMGGGAWGAGYSNGIAHFIWDGIYGHSYTVDYHAAVPVGSPSGFGGVPFAYHFEGTVQAVPVPAAAWLFGSGLIGLATLSRRKGVGEHR